MTNLVLLLSGVAVGVVATLHVSKQGPRRKFTVELLMAACLALANLAFDDLTVRVLALLLFPTQVRDLLRAAPAAGVVCLVRRKHTPGGRMLVDKDGRHAGGVMLNCANPSHDHPLSPTLLADVAAMGLSLMPAPCRLCGKQAVA